MKRTIIFCTLILSLNSFAQNTNYDNITKIDNNFSFVKLNDKYGIIDASGKIIVPVRYSFVTICETVDAVKKYAKVQENDKFGLIDMTISKEVSPIMYDDIECFRDGRSKVKLNNKFGYIDEEGKEKIPVKYE